MISVLFVCLGNICRSPMAESVFQRKLEQAGSSDKVSCDSAGTGSYHIGSFPDKRTIAVCELNGIKMTHKARLFTKQDFMDFDYIIPMDLSNRSNIEKLRPAGSKATVLLMREFDNAGEVPDPYYGGDEGFTEVYEILDRCCDHLIDYLKKHHETL